MRQEQRKTLKQQVFTFKPTVGRPARVKTEGEGEGEAPAGGNNMEPLAGMLACVRWGQGCWSRFVVSVSIITIGTRQVLYQSQRCLEG
jgi:hypothetical protein